MNPITSNISGTATAAHLSDAEHILRHCRTAGGCVEGIGMSSVSADAAIKRCCFWGRPVREIGVCRGRNGMYYACVRYR
jgi:hypothetical protein